MDIHVKDNNLVCDSAFDAEEYLKYASNHGFNVVFTDTATAKMAEIALMFKKAGFGIEVQAKGVYSPDGLQLPDKPVFVFINRFNTDFPYLSQARDFAQLRKCYSDETLKEFEYFVKEYMESSRKDSPNEICIDPIIAWLEGLITIDDLKDVHEPNYWVDDPVLIKDSKGHEIHYPNAGHYSYVDISHEGNQTVVKQSGSIYFGDFIELLIYLRHKLNTDITGIYHGCSMNVGEHTTAKELTNIYSKYVKEKMNK